MLAAKSINVRDNFKEWCDKIINGETVVISRPKNENIYMISEKEYNALQKAKRNAEYLARLYESIQNHKNNDTIFFSLDELMEMESDDYTPSAKIRTFESKHKIKRV